MAHEITIRASGKAEAAFAAAGGAAWHGLGQMLAAGATIEQWRVAAGMDWNIRRAAVRYFADPEGSQDCSMLASMPDRNVLFRSDSLAPLGDVSADYQIVQPAQVLEFFRDLVSDHGMTLESAGTLFGGKRFWALAKIAEQAVVPGDMVGGYLLLSTSADGSMATEARQTTVRVVCNNTLRMARAEDGGAVPVVKLSHRSAFCDKRVKSQLGMARDNFERGMADIRRLASLPVSQMDAADMVRALLRPDEAKAKERAAELQAQAAVAAAQSASGAGAVDFASLIGRASQASEEVTAAEVAEKAKRAPRGESAILDLFGRSALGNEIAGAGGTAWGFVNAVTEFVDHHKSARSADHRTSAAWFGEGDELKSAALEMVRARFA